MTSPEKATRPAISLMWRSERYFSMASLYRTADLRVGHDHCFGLAVEQLADSGAEVLDE